MDFSCFIFSIFRESSVDIRGVFCSQKAQLVLIAGGCGCLLGYDIRETSLYSLRSLVWPRIPSAEGWHGKMDTFFPQDCYRLTPGHFWR